MTNRRFTEKEEEFIIKNGDYFGVAVCADKLGRPIRSVSAKMLRLVGHATWKCSANEKEIENLVYEDEWQYLTLDFNTTKTPKELAYFLGYFWADGYIDPKGNLVIEITKEDHDDISRIFSRLASFRQYSRQREGRKEQGSFWYPNDRENTEQLRFFGKYPKSIESHEKILNFIPEVYRVHFLRGLFDGDGCIYTSKTKFLSSQITLSGCYEMDWSFLVKFLEERYGIHFRVIRSTNNQSKYSQIISTNSLENQSFLNALYTDCEDIFLKRKRTKADTILNYPFCQKPNNREKDKIVEEISLLKFNKRTPILIKKPKTELVDVFLKDGKIIPKYSIGERVVNKAGDILKIEKITINEDYSLVLYFTKEQKNPLAEFEILGKYLKDATQQLLDETDSFE